MIGPQGSGKTSLLYKHKFKKWIDTTTTQGFNADLIFYKNFRFTVWDLGGNRVIKKLWKNFTRKKHGLIFVVDASDDQEMESSRRDLGNLLNNGDHEELKNIPLVILANKLDQWTSKKVLTKRQIQESLDLDNITSPLQKWEIIFSSVVYNNCLNQTFEFFRNVLT